MKLVKILTVGAIMALCASAFAIDGREVVKMALDVEDPLFNTSAVVMDLIEKNGAVESRQVLEYGRSKDGKKSLVMLFKSPASVKDTRFLQIENGEGKADDKFIYLPALKSTRRVNTSEGSKSFMGTDATYDDMSTRDIDVDNHELLDENAEKNGYSCYVVKSVAKNPADSQYSYRIQWIDKKTNVPIYAEMYDKKGKGNLLKKLTIEKLEPVASKSGKTYNTPIVSLLENVQTGHKTRLTIQKIVVDEPIPERVFTQAFLNTGK